MSDENTESGEVPSLRRVIEESSAGMAALDRGDPAQAAKYFKSIAKEADKGKDKEEKKKKK